MKNLVLLALLSLSVQCHAQIITTIAGHFYTTVDTMLGDGGPATNAILDGPYAVAFDGKGNYYITDGYDNRIRKVDAAGIITTIAGFGNSLSGGGYNGDGIPATAAQIYNPIGIVFDHSGNLYFVDASNNRVRKIDTSGIITTVAGNGSSIYNGDNIPADSASIYDPHCVAIDAHGNLYITDFGHFRIRKVNPSGIITTVAGTGIAGYTGDNGHADTARIDGPYGIVLDDTGNIYFADYYKNVVRKIDTGGIITTFAGTGNGYGPLGDGGPADSASLNGPAGIAINGSNNIYIPEINHMRIRMVTAATGIITTIAGDSTEGYGGDGGLATNAELNTPTGVTIAPSGTLYIADFSNGVIRRVGWPLSVPISLLSPKSMIIYPNPATVQITIQSADEVIRKIIITDISGQAVNYQILNADPHIAILGISGLLSGAYFVTVNNTQVQKIIKE